MGIIYSPKYSETENLIINKIALECKILPDTAYLLYARGFDTVEKAKAFLNPGKHNFNSPFLLNGIVEAVDRIKTAFIKGENVLIFGDYDADGTCASVVLYNCLKEMGIISRIIIPERDDGYGLNLELIKRANAEKQVDLIITVDCGISDFLVIESIKEMGIDVIVTDHHEPPEVLPDCIVINPKIKGQAYPFTQLCGAGVSYKLGVALMGEKADKYLDFVSLATVADSMELVSENRDIVTVGLKMFNDEKVSPVFKYIIPENTKEITSRTLSFSVAPKINAGGRMGDSSCALRLFLSEDENEAFDLAVKLNAYNIERQESCDFIYKQAIDKINSEQLYNDQVIVVADDNWKSGFIGIVAARLVEEYSRPVIVFAGFNDSFKGSARSVDGINIFEIISNCSDKLLGFGGHSQAAGLSVKKEDLVAFRSDVNKYVHTTYGNIKHVKNIFVDKLISNPISIRFAEEINLLEPFGVGNLKPLFAIKTNAVSSMPLNAKGIHFSIKTDVIELLDFNGYDHVLPLSMPVEKTLVFELNLSVFNGKKSLKGYLRNIENNYSNLEDMKYFLFRTELDKLLTLSVSCDVKRQAVDVNEQGVVYVITDTDNLKSYPELDCLDKNVLEIKGRLLSSVILAGAKSVPIETKKIVYLDTPYAYLDCNCEQVLSNKGLCGYKALDDVSLDRSVFAEVYEIIRNCLGVDYNSFTKAVDNGELYDNIYQFIVCEKVFMELGFFYVEKGILKQNLNIKNALTNSITYSKINSIKG